MENIFSQISHRSWILKTPYDPSDCGALFHLLGRQRCIFLSIYIYIYVWCAGSLLLSLTRSSVCSKWIITVEQVPKKGKKKTCSTSKGVGERCRKNLPVYLLIRGISCCFSPLLFFFAQEQLYANWRDHIQPGWKYVNLMYSLTWSSLVHLCLFRQSVGSGECM